MNAIGGNSSASGITNSLHCITEIDSQHSAYNNPSKTNVCVHKFVGDSVVNVYINHEKKFAFVEMRTVEEASNAMALDGIIFEARKVFIFGYIYIYVWI